MSAVPAAAAAQTDVEELGRRYGARPPAAFYEAIRRDPTAFQFSRQNGWIRRAQVVAAARSRARGRSMVRSLQTRPLGLQAGAVSGDVNVPVFLILFANTDSTTQVQSVPRSAIEQRLYGTDPAPPYSVHTYYLELSNGLVRVNGAVAEWTRVPGTSTDYEGDNNGLDRTQMTNLLRDIAAAHDDTLDFGQFDNDGPDGVPNSADDDGFVDAVVMIHPKVDGSCQRVNPDGETSIWAHRWSAGSAILTNDTSLSTGGLIRISDYIVQGGQGGDDGCTSNEPQAMGVVAHETGHLFNLPDLYDTGSGSGIGRWGLMGSGNQQVPTSPAHMMAWSKGELGWVTEVMLDRDTTLDISPVETADTAYILPIPNSDEYFLLENRQRLGSDAEIISAGLLIWHIDSVLVRLRRVINTVNAATPYGVALEQADGQDDLRNGVNRGDPADPFPAGGNRSFGHATAPSSVSNAGRYSHVELSDITLLAPNGPIRLQVQFDPPDVIVATDSNAVFRLDGVAYDHYEEYLEPGRSYLLEMDSVQVVNSGRRRYTWVSWSNGQPRSHTFTAGQSNDSIVAAVDAEFRVRVVTSGTGAGSVNSDVPLDLVGGEYLVRDSIVTLTATVDSADHLFEGWFGVDTVTTDAELVLRMHRPFDLSAVFASPLVLELDSVPPALVATPYLHQLVATGGLGSATWQVLGTPLPPGLQLAGGYTWERTAKETLAVYEAVFQEG